jgi:hypothetical protein
MSATESKKRLTLADFDKKFAEAFPTASGACSVLCERLQVESDLYEQAEASNNQAAAKRILAVINALGVSLRANHCKCTLM